MWPTLSTRSDARGQTLTTDPSQRGVGRKDATNLTQAIRAKLEAQAEFVL